MRLGDTSPMAQIALVLVIGLLAGILGGFIGVGGGVLIVPALVLLFGFDQHLAVGTSLGALLPPVGI
ncbi:MAG TPA: TSUP family transporter, partial [Methylomirabilota bacterium]|nr:TSUP family transporter [Methylomirabilota bacterium]